jgi:hypothetical protein
MTNREAQTDDQAVINRGKISRVRWLGLTLALLSVAAVFLLTTSPRPAQTDDLIPCAELHGAFWLLEEGFKSSPMLSNTSPEPIRVFPWGYDPPGAGVVLSVIALREFERRQVSLRPWLTQAGVRSTSGHLRVRHTGPGFALAAQVMLTNPRDSLSFDFLVEAGFYQYRSPRLDGLLLLLESQSRVQVILTNTSNHPLTVRPTVMVNNHRHPAHPVTLRPQQTRQMDIEAWLDSVHVSVREGGLRLEHDGEPGDVCSSLMAEAHPAS